MHAHTATDHHRELFRVCLYIGTELNAPRTRTESYKSPRHRCLLQIAPKCKRRVTNLPKLLNFDWTLPQQNFAPLASFDICLSNGGQQWRRQSLLLMGKVSLCSAVFDATVENGSNWAKLVFFNVYQLKLSRQKQRMALATLFVNCGDFAARNFRSRFCIENASTRAYLLENATFRLRSDFAE